MTNEQECTSAVLPERFYNEKEIILVAIISLLVGLLLGVRL